MPRVKDTGKNKTNNQHAFRPQDCYITHIMVYALRPEMFTPSHVDRQWMLRDADGQPTTAEADGLKVGFPVTDGTQPQPLDVTHKRLVVARLQYQPALTITRWVRVPDVNNAENLSLPQQPVAGVGPWLPLLEKVRTVA